MPDENAATAETPAVAVAAATATPTPPAAETPAGVTLTPEMFKEITAKLSRLDQIEADSARKVKEAEDRAIAKDVENQNVRGLMERLTAKEKADAERLGREKSEEIARVQREAGEKHRQSEVARLAAEERAARMEGRLKREALAIALTDAVNKHSDKLASGAAEHLRTIWKDSFTVVDDGDKYVARTNDGSPVEDFVAAALASDKYSIFLKAASRGGGTATPGANNATTSTPTPTPTGTELPEPKNMGEAVVRYMQGQKKAAGDATGNMALGMGLKPLAR